MSFKSGLSLPAIAPSVLRHYPGAADLTRLRPSVLSATMLRWHRAGFKAFYPTRARGIGWFPPSTIFDTTLPIYWRFPDNRANETRILPVARRPSSLLIFSSARPSELCSTPFLAGENGRYIHYRRVE